MKQPFHSTDRITLLSNTGCAEYIELFTHWYLLDDSFDLDRRDKEPETNLFSDKKQIFTRLPFV
jgi:hypothetical protein